MPFVVLLYKVGPQTSVVCGGSLFVLCSDVQYERYVVFVEFCAIAEGV